jgi:hypothetical protein
MTKSDSVTFYVFTIQYFLIIILGYTLCTYKKEKFIVKQWCLPCYSDVHTMKSLAMQFLECVPIMR